MHIRRLTAIDQAHSYLEFGKIEPPSIGNVGESPEVARREAEMMSAGSALQSQGNSTTTHHIFIRSPRSRPLSLKTSWQRAPEM